MSTVTLDTACKIRRGLDEFRKDEKDNPDMVKNAFGTFNFRPNRDSAYGSVEFCGIRDLECTLRSFIDKDVVIDKFDHDTYYCTASDKIIRRYDYIGLLVWMMMVIGNKSDKNIEIIIEDWSRYDVEDE